jgi:hypothetical protein
MKNGLEAGVERAWASAEARDAWAQLQLLTIALRACDEQLTQAEVELKG